MLLRSWLLLTGLLVAGSGNAQLLRQKMEAVPIGDAGAWFPPSDYPPDAVKAGRSGRVATSIGVDSTGRIVSCVVGVSSGTQSLDDRTCELLKARGRFNAATDKNGLPVGSVRAFSVRWSVPEETAQNTVDLTKPTTVSAEMEMVIDPDGLVESCKVTGEPGGFDGCSKLPVGSQSGTRFMDRGVPVRAVIRDCYIREMKVVTLP